MGIDVKGQRGSPRRQGERSPQQGRAAGGGRLQDRERAGGAGEGKADWGGSRVGARLAHVVLLGIHHNPTKAQKAAFPYLWPFTPELPLSLRRVFSGHQPGRSAGKEGKGRSNTSATSTCLESLSHLKRSFSTCTGRQFRGAEGSASRDGRSEEQRMARDETGRGAFGWSQWGVRATKVKRGSERAWEGGGLGECKCPGR